MSKVAKDSFVSAPTCKDLCMTGEFSERWLSHPESRIVINPFNFDASPEGGLTQCQYSDRPSLPLNVGYLDPWAVNTRGPELKDALMVLESEGSGGFSEACLYSTLWQPHQLSFKADYPCGLHVEGFDWLYDIRTIVRRIQWQGPRPLVIAGQYRESLTLDSSVITVTTENYHYSIALSSKYHSIRFYESRDALLGNKDPMEEPAPGQGFFALVIPQEDKQGEIAVAVTIDTALIEPAQLQVSARTAANDPQQASRLVMAERFWDLYLAKIPQITKFNIEHVENHGVTFADIMQLYYVGWVLMYSSLAPANPELNFPYRQMTAGKPSLWAYGDPRATYTAAWDSLYGLQLCAFVDPDAACDAFTGIMSMVDDEGMLAGESLPVMRARTAWIIYNQRRDAEFLRKNFSNLERNLVWSMDHPYWIWMGNNPLDSKLKDSDFAASILVDIPFFVKICLELDMHEKAEEWNRRHDSFMDNYITWTFPDDGSLPTENYVSPEGIIDDGSGLRSAGNALWVTKGLYIQKLSRVHVMKLMDLFYSVFDKNKPFCDFPFVKLEEIQYTTYGLLENGYVDEARTMIESSVRDVVRSRFLGENYTKDEPPVCWGVRPSLFGFVQLTDGIWMRNGYRYDSGSLIPCHIFDTP